MRAELVCADGVALLAEYLEGALDPRERARIDAHLAGCARCVAYVRSYCETPRIFREATAAREPAGLEQRLLRALRARLGPLS